jgi:hypothetical protein
VAACAVANSAQEGQARADYGQQLLAGLSKRLKVDFGRGFDPSNLSMMRAFYLAYPIFDAVRQELSHLAHPKVDALRRELSWTHYHILLRVDRPYGRFPCPRRTRAGPPRFRRKMSLDTPTVNDVL